jgi:hypothetical protein
MTALALYTRAARVGQRARPMMKGSTLTARDPDEGTATLRLRDQHRQFFARRFIADPL